MPKKKRRKRRAPQQTSRPVPQRSAAGRRAVVTAYERWRSSTVTEAESAAGKDPAAEAELIAILLELKAEELHSPDPGMWSSHTTLQLFLDHLSGKPVLTMRQAGLLQGTVLSYFDVLHQTRRGHSCAASPELASLLVASFTISAQSIEVDVRNLDPGPELPGEVIDPGRLDPVAARDLLEQSADDIDDLHEDVDRLSSAGSDAEYRDVGEEEGWSSWGTVLTVLDRLDRLREALDRLESDVYVVATPR